MNNYNMSMNHDSGIPYEVLEELDIPSIELVMSFYKNDDKLMIKAISQSYTLYTKLENKYKKNPDIIKEVAYQINKELDTEKLINFSKRIRTI